MDKNDIDAVSPIVKSVVTRVRRAYNLPRDLEHVSYDDLKQAGYEAAIRWIDNYDPTRGATLQTYLYPYIYGAVIDELRKTSRFNRYRVDTITHIQIDDCEIEADDSPLEDAIRAEMSYNISNKIRRLTRNERSAISMALEDVDSKEIAEIMSVSYARVRQLIANATQKIGGRLTA